ncbi:hypothetical protein FGRMN_9008 [Fusarium graminum]|nr:hypothetical protein FGRMN_9008 [Fusarium graminum]
MKTLIFAVALLGVTGLCSANDQGEMEMDTWCVTYVSTYLAPAANQGDGPTNEPGERPTGQESGRLPFVPSIRPTFAKNTSSVTPTTFSGLSAIGSDSSTLGVQSSSLSLIGSDLSTSETQKDVSTSQELSSDAPTSNVESAISTSLAPTSSGIIEPQGRSIIFQVSVPNDNKRNINKRAAGGFVGNDNPGSCTFAAVFNLAEGQLFESGVPIYYASGDDYKELSGQDDPPQAAIKTTFAAGGNGLVFTNPGLPNGEAGFCQGPDGRVYITFTSGPPGCLVVNLAAYEATQCQNGRLVGVDEPSSASTIATSDALESEASTTETLPTIESASSVVSSSENPRVSTSITQSGEPISESSFVTLSSMSSSTSGHTSSELSSNTESGDSSFIRPTTSITSSDRSLSTSSAALAESAETTESTTLAASSPSTVSTDSADSTGLTTSITEVDASSSLTETSSLLVSSSEISGPSSSSAESLETTVESTETLVSSIETTTKPLDTTAESTEITADPIDTTTEIVETTTDPLDTTTEIAETTSETLETTTEDACVAEVTDPAGSPPLDDRKEQCSDLNVVTVSPSTVTVTETLKKRFVWVVPTSWPPTPTKKRFARDDDEATTIFPTEFPEGYAAFCDDAEDYYRACSSLGVTRTTTTLPTPTETEQNPPCRAKQMVKRAGEAMGYEFEEHWELMTMPGYTMIAI